MKTKSMESKKVRIKKFFEGLKYDWWAYRQKRHIRKLIAKGEYYV